MTQQFTASEVRESAIAVATRDMEYEAKMLQAYADRLEADEKAVPVATVRQALTGGYWIDWHGKQMPDYLGCDLYIHPAPSDAERLTEALRKIAREPIRPWPDPFAHSHEAFARAVHASWCDMNRTAREALAIHSAQAQPPIQCNHAGRIICGTVHEGRSEVAWCNDCGEITHGSEATPTPNLPRHEDWCKKNVVAFGCLREGEGESVCKTWCGHGNHCAVTLRDDCRKSSTAKAQPPAASVTDAMDAARYRWLLKTQNTDCEYHSLEDLAWYALHNLSSEETSNAIDAAMAKESGR